MNTTVPNLDDDDYRGGERPPFLPWGKGDYELNLIGFRFSDGKDERGKKVGEPAFFATFECVASDREEVRVGRPYTMRFVYRNDQKAGPVMKKLVAFLAAVDGTVSTDAKFKPTEFAQQLCDASKNETLRANKLRVRCFATDTVPNAEGEVFTNHAWEAVG